MWQHCIYYSPCRQYPSTVSTFIHGRDSKGNQRSENWLIDEAIKHHYKEIKKWFRDHPIDSYVVIKITNELDSNSGTVYATRITKKSDFDMLTEGINKLEI